MAEQKKSNMWLIIGAVVVVLAVVYWFMSSGTEPAAIEPATAPAVSTESPAVDDGAVSVEPVAPAPVEPAAPAPAEPEAPSTN